MRIRPRFLRFVVSRFRPLSAVLAIPLFLLVSCGEGNVNNTEEYQAFLSATENNNYPEALKQSEALLKKYPEAAGAWYAMGKSYLLLGEPENAIEHYKQALKRKPDDFFTHLDLGVAYGQSGQLDNAIGSLQSAIELKPSYIEAHRTLGYTYLIGRRYEEALPCYERVVELDPDDAKAFESLGTTYLKLGKMEKSVENLVKSVKLNPSDARSNGRLGSVYLQNGDLVKAIDYCNRSLEADPTSEWAPFAIADLAIAHIKKGEFEIGGVWAARLALQTNKTSNDAIAQSIKQAFKRAGADPPTDKSKINSWIDTASKIQSGRG